MMISTLIPREAKKDSVACIFQIFDSIKDTKHVQFARIHTSSLINIEKFLNRPITKFYNGDDVNVIVAELRLIKTRLTSFHKKHNLL